MQGSLHLDFKGLPYNLRARQRITAEGEAVQKASMWVRPCSRESQQEKSVEDIQSWYFCCETSPVEYSLYKISHEELQKTGPIMRLLSTVQSAEYG
jgi:hypothetical protein